MYKKFCKLLDYLKLKLQEKSRGKLKYIYKNNGSNELIIVFSAFGGEMRKYNYVRTLSNIHIDQLFILDIWGYKGSYYWFEQGSDLPQQETRALVDSILKKKEYKKIYTAGSSKGGTSAIYYGLEINATAIFAGSCQYNVGTYLSIKRHKPIFEAMMGAGITEYLVNKLNDMMPTQINKYSNSSAEVHLIYSKNEPTYQEHIVDLINQLHLANIKVLEDVCEFDNHEDIGLFFAPYLKSYFIDKQNANMI